MTILTWEKPPKARDTATHNALFASDTGIPGTYVPNMPDSWQRAWRAKHVRGKDERVEVRVRVQPWTQVLLVVREQTVKMSMNGPLEVAYDWFTKQLAQAVAEARDEILNPKH